MATHMSNPVPRRLFQSQTARPTLFWTFLVAVLVSAAPHVVSASIGGSISGTVRDPADAVIPGATVSAVETGTAIRYSTKSDSAGFYSFPLLPIGHYRVEVQAAGFKELRLTGLTINANSALKVDVKLEIGQASQEVIVSSEALQVETVNTQMGEVIGSQKMTAVPLNGRSYTDLLALQPGVVPVSTGLYSSVQVSGGLNPGNLSISGQREEANGFMVNGGAVEEGIFNGTAVIPVLNSIAEFRILTNNFDAEYGNYSGGLVNVVTKSGAAQFHGDVFEFLRNSNLDARNFFSPARGVFRQNQFGGTFGGPIRREKAFVFGSYQGTRQTVGVDTGLIAVPSLANREGDFSDVASSLRGSVSGPYFASLLSQALGYPVTAGERYYVSGCTSSTQCVFPNAMIPRSIWSSPAPHLIQYIPQPNTGGKFFSTSANNQTLRDDKGSVRVDGNSRLGMLSAYYFADDYNRLQPYPAATVPGFPASTLGRSQQINLSDTKSGTSHVNELRLNYMRNALVKTAPAGPPGPTLSSLGFVTGPNTSGIVPLNPSIENVPPMPFNNFTIGTVTNVTNLYYNTFQILDNFAQVSGTHTMKFGGDFHYKQINEYLFNAENGFFQFFGAETGVDFADFLLGAPTRYIQSSIQPVYTRSRYYGLYLQDSWRARRSLTFNYGLRWEVSTPWWEKHNQLETIVPGVQSVVFPGAPKGWVVPGDPGIPSTVAPTRYNNFAPRIGLAYSPNGNGWLTRKLFNGSGKTSIRASWGIFFTAFGDAVQTNNVIGDAPFGLFWLSPTPPLFATPFIDRNSGRDEGQRFPATFPPLDVSAAHPDPNVNWAQYEPISASPGFFHRNQLQTTEAYTISVQRQFGGETLLSLSYVGTQSHHLLASLEANLGSPTLCLSVSQPSQVMPATPTCGPFGENGVYHPVTGGIINGTRAPLGPLFGSEVLFATIANSNYNSLQATLRHTSGRLEWLAGYTYSKSLDDASSYGTGGLTINPVNSRLSRGISLFDMTHNFVASYSYELPFDKLFGRNRATQGWTISGITRFATGLPVFISEANDHSLLGMDIGGAGQTLDTPNFTPGPLNFTDPRSRKPYFNTSLFSHGLLGQLGTASSRFFHGPGLNNWDMSLTKNLRLTESKALEFRVEFFNAFNHAQFLNPVGNFLSSAFGLVTKARDPRIGQVAIKFVF